MIEVAEATLTNDRTVKKRLYARAGIPVYWVVNLIDKQIEVYTLPSGLAESPDYGGRQIIAAGENTAVIVGGLCIGQIAASNLFPS